MESSKKLLIEELQISPMGLGAWQFGDSLFWSYGKTHQYKDALDTFVRSINLGINFIDTAEFYGFGRSEKLIGEFINIIDKRPIIATKYFPYPWRLTYRSLIKALQSSLKRLDLEFVDLYQIHWPFFSSMMDIWSKGLSEIIELGLARYVGVSNFNKQQTDRMYGLLKKHGIPLVSNQLEYNLLNRKIEKNGLLHICNELDITVIAYSPLAQGLLTGKYYGSRPNTGIRRYTYGRIDPHKLKRLIDTLRYVGENYGGKSPSQVALNWLTCKGVLPIPGAKNKEQAEENVGALGWQLDEQDVQLLDESSDELEKE